MSNIRVDIFLNAIIFEQWKANCLQTCHLSDMNLLHRFSLFLVYCCYCDHFWTFWAKFLHINASFWWSVLSKCSSIKLALLYSLNIVEYYSIWSNLVKLEGKFLYKISVDIFSWKISVVPIISLLLMLSKSR